jgi:hypothetical protein
MIISPQRRYVFVHIPKTGGTSLSLALEGRAAADDILVGDTPKAKRRKGRLEGLRTPGRLWKHSTLRDVEGLFDPTEMFVFTLVRNPWDRMVSYYHWLLEQSFDHPAVTVAKANSFTAFLRDPSVQSSVRGSPYSSYVCDASGQDRCTLYARLEHPLDLDPLWQHLGFKLTIPHVNRSQRQFDWRGYYDSEAFDIVAEIAAEDIAKFGYATEL